MKYRLIHSNDKVRNLLRYIRYIYILNRTDFFDAKFYRRQTGKINGLRLVSIVDYCIFGERKFYKPNEWFDPKVYLEINTDVKASISPTYHYITSGKREGRLYVGISNSNDSIKPYTKIKTPSSFAVKLTRKKLEGLKLVNSQSIIQIESCNQPHKDETKKTKRPDLLLRKEINDNTRTKDAKSNIPKKTLPELFKNERLHITQYSYGTKLLSKRQIRMLINQYPCIDSVTESTDIAILVNVYSDRKKIHISLEEFMQSLHTDRMEINVHQAIYKINPVHLTFESLMSKSKNHLRKLQRQVKITESISRKMSKKPVQIFNWRGSSICISCQKNGDIIEAGEIAMLIQYISNRPLNGFGNIKCISHNGEITLCAASSANLNKIKNSSFDLGQINYTVEVEKYKK